MQDHNFEVMVARLEPQAHTRAYLLKVMLLALLGAAYLWLMLLVVLLLFGLALASIMFLKAFAIKIIIPIGALLYVMLRAMWVRFDPPTGYRITAKQAPQLFALLAQLRKQLGTARLHRVLLTDDFNAGVMQMPRFGVFGGHRNYLLLGLPLMKALSPEQLSAVLAHEMGHLAHGHARIGNWIYCQRLRWARLLHELEQKNAGGSFLFKGFFNWFAPYFAAYTFPLARANEYQADAASAKLTSSKVAAQALTGTAVLGRYWGERFWPAIYQQADQVAQPAASFLPYANMSRRFGSELEAASLTAWLEQAMAEKTSCDDTHPALPDRLRSIGAQPELAIPPAGQGADSLLGPMLPKIEAEFDQSWQARITPGWEQRFNEVQELRQKLIPLDARHEAGEELSLEEEIERASLWGQIGRDPAQVLELWQQLLQRAPDNARVCLALGSRLLELQDDSACALLARAAQLEEHFQLLVYRNLRDYYRVRQDDVNAQIWQEKLSVRAELEQNAEDERSRIQPGDQFEPHGLPEPQLAALLQQLKQHETIRHVWLVRKTVQYLPHQPCYLLGFSCSSMLTLHTDGRANAVIEALQRQVQFPEGTVIFCVDGDNAHFSKKMDKVAGSKLF